MLPPSSPKEFRPEQNTADRQSGWDAEAEQGRRGSMITTAVLTLAITTLIVLGKGWYHTKT
jgi:hypothetical protein